jgi:hypothetical protein
MPIVKSLYIPQISVDISRTDIAHRFSKYGQISRIDFSKDDGYLGDVFIHFFSFNPCAYLQYQHDQYLPAYVNLLGQTISVLPYTSRFYE